MLPALALRNYLTTTTSVQRRSLSLLRKRKSLVSYKRYSSLSEHRAFQHNASDSAILHGGSQTGKPKSSPRSSINSKKNKSQGMAAVVPKKQAQESQSAAFKQATRKRQADGLRESQGRRKHGGSSSQQKLRAMHLKDEAWLRKEMHVPTNSDYPDIPEGYFKSVKEKLWSSIQGVAALESSYVNLSAEAFRCTLRYESSSRNVVVEGEGRNKKSAEHTAYLHLMAKFHEQGVIRDVINRKSSEHNSPEHQMAAKGSVEDRDAIVDIYNYCARFDATPEIDYQTKQQSKGYAARIRRIQGKTRNVVECSITLEAQDIKGIGVAHDRKSAETRAAWSFKEGAEKYHRMQGSDALVIKDSTALTVESAGKWMEFYKIVRPGVLIDNQVTEMARRSFERGNTPFQSQVLVNGEAVGASVVAATKDRATKLGLLTAAVALKLSDPSLFPRYLRALELGNGEILKPLAPLDMRVDEDCFLVMRETLLAARRAGLPDEAPKMKSDHVVDSSGRLFRRPVEQHDLESRSLHLKRTLDIFQGNPALVELRRKRAELPMNQYRAQVLDMVNNNMYSIIVGATGSGKTTQVPQILLEDAINKGNGATCNIVCTQPRRIAATSVARRVADEKAEPLQDSVGYHVRFDVKHSRENGSIMYCTTGILLQQLQRQPDSIMDYHSHIVVDEVHERDMLIDFLLILLKKNILRRHAQGKSTPHVVLMSATMDTELFASYFKVDVPGKGLVDCPSLSVPGRVFPVKEKYLHEILQDLAESKQPMSSMRADKTTKEYLECEERFRKENSSSGTSDETGGVESVIDWKRQRQVTSDGEMAIVNDKENALVPIGLIACTVAHIARTTEEGAILVFLPGLDEIVKVEEELLQKSDLGVDLNDQTRFQIIKLHSTIPDAHTTVFQKVPQGCRKIILSTNIAETSVTIPDVQHVVDTGKLREKSYDQTRRMTMLLCNWISKSNAKQRAGRAGRVQNGNYHALYSKERFDSLRVVGLPELLRSDLQEICLDIKSQAFTTPVREFLAESIEPPAPKAVDMSVNNLQALDALTDEEEITPLGRLLAQLPVHPTLGKMIVLGIIFRCLDPMLILGSAGAERTLFTQPLGLRAEANRAKLSFVEGSGSDHIAIINAVRRLRQIRDIQGEHAFRDFATRNFLHMNAFRTIMATAAQIEQMLVESGLIPGTPQMNRANSQLGAASLNENSHKVPLIKALLLAGTHPNLAVNIGGLMFRTPGEKKAIIHPSSTNNIPWTELKKKNTSNNDPDAKRISFGSLYTFSTMAKAADGNSVTLRDTSESTPLMALLFGGKLKRQLQRPNVIEIDDWLPFYIQSDDRRTPQTLIEFRKALERLLAGAFQELGNAARGRTIAGGRPYLADDRVIELFAGGMVEVLDRDIKGKEAIRQRGWSSDTYSPNPSRGTSPWGAGGTRTSRDERKGIGRY